jgi:hypothetical protein
MKPELQAALIQDCPNLYLDHDAPSDAWTRMQDGLCVEDGWEPLVREVSVKVEAIIVAMPEEERSRYRMFQVKQKLGGLRLYMNKDSTKEIDELLNESEHRSFSICETCGGSGTRRTTQRNYIYIGCNQHIQK